MKKTASSTSRRVAGGVALGAAATAAALIAPMAFAGDDLEWTHVDIPNTDVVPMSVAAVAADDIWAAGSDVSDTGQSSLTHWDGNEWSEIDHPEGVYYDGLDALASDDVWAAGQDADYMDQVIHYNGQEWSAVGEPQADTDIAELIDVSGLEGGTAWAVGHQTNFPEDAESSIADTTQRAVERANGSSLGIAADDEQFQVAQYWDGEQWQVHQFEVPDDALDIGVRQVHAVSDDEVWVIGEQMVENDDGLNTLIPWITHYADGEWTTVDTGDSEMMPVDVADLGDGQIAIVGTNADSEGNQRPAMLTWDGEQFTETTNDDIDSTGGPIHPDGQGGAYISGGTTEGDTPTMLHYQDGDFTEQPAPSFDDRTWTTALTITPDTGQLWTVGTHVDEQGYPTGGVSSHTE